MDIKNATPEDLLRAKQLRELSLQRHKELMEACSCLWPMIRYRNSHGHDDKCPAIEVWKKQKNSTLAEG